MQDEWGGAGPGTDRAIAVEGPLIRVRLSLSRMLWRIGPAWAVLFGAVAAGWLPFGTDAILRLAAAVMLGDLLWGISRRSPSNGSFGSPVAADAPFVSLPYAQPDAPLLRLLGALGRGLGMPADQSWQPSVVGALLALGLSLLLGPAALILTLLAALVLAWAWLWSARRGTRPRLALALLDVALPGVLGVSLAPGLPWEGGLPQAALALLAGFTVLQWGVYGAPDQDRAVRAGILAGEAGVLLALVALQRPVACALAAALFAPPTWWLARNRHEAAARGAFWWWAAFLAVALVAA